MFTMSNKFFFNYSIGTFRTITNEIKIGVLPIFQELLLYYLNSTRFE